MKLLESDVRCVADRKMEMDQMDELQISLLHFCPNLDGGFIKDYASSEVYEAPLVGRKQW